jgi:erythronate-4-phosphate dehydrogenase
MNIFFDENIPYAREFFSQFGKLQPFAGRKLSAEQVKHADVLLVRSITQVNESLLHLNQRLKFVGTATIGVDHIDQSYLGARNIPFASAPGCNAVSVAEYVLSALLVLAQRYQLDISGFTVGIVGAGNTGSRLSEKLTALGIKYKLCDPYLAQSDDPREFYSLEQVLDCDVISLHVPLTTNGQYPTYHLLDGELLAKLSARQILINACRGEVIDNQALLALKQGGHPVKLVLDVWENEPDLLTELVDYCELATAHIAGYSLEGKARGTQMLYQAFSEYLGQKSSLALTMFLPKLAIETIELAEPLSVELLASLALLIYDIRRDDAIFRQQLAIHGFDYLRKNYPVRREFSALTLKAPSFEQIAQAIALGFSHKIEGEVEENGTAI